MEADRCGCGDADCWHLEAGYPWCRACQDHHRPWPTCPGITPEGEPADGEMFNPHEEQP